MARFRYYLAGAIASIFSVSARAQQDEFESDVSDIIGRQPDPVNDYAIGWLQQIFGDFIFIPWGGSTSQTGIDTTIVAHAIGFTNVVAMLLGIVIVGYVMLTGVVRTAHEGEVLGRNWSSMWLPLRTAAAFGLITPVVGIGGGVVSVIQAFVISLIIIGSNAGTLLWDKLGGVITDGTPLIASTQSAGLTPSRQLLRSLVCAQSVYMYEENKGNNRPEVAHIQVADNSYVRVNGPVGSADFTIPPLAKGIDFGNINRNCGSVSFAEISEASSYRTYHADAIDQGHAAAREEIGSLLNDLSPIAEILVRGTSEGGLGGGQNLEAMTQVPDNEETQALNIVVDQYAEIALGFSRDFSAAITAATVGDPRIAAEWKEEVTRGGWGGAGMWFFEISRFQMLNSNVSSKVLGSIAETTPPKFCGLGGIFSRWSDCDDYEEMAAMDMTTGVDIIHQMAADNLGSGVIASNAEKAQARLDSATPNKLNDGMFDDLASSMAQATLSAASSFGSRWNEGMAGDAAVSEATNGLSSPFRTVTAIGQTLNWGAGAAWGLGLVASISHGTLTATSSIPIIGTGAGVGAGIAWWMLTSFGAIAMAIVPLGFVLAFMIPFMPIITWTRLLAAYLLTAIEAVVAAPLAIIMMATPEGEGIAGTRLERAIQMLASIMLRPTLLIVGLVSALMLAYVSFEILNFFFWRVAEMVTGSGIFEFLAIIVIYTTAAFQVAKASIMIMHKLPDQILDWMAGGVGGRSFGDDAEASIQSGMEQTKGSIGGVASGLQGAISRGGPPKPLPSGPSRPGAGGDTDRDRD